MTLDSPALRVMADLEQVCGATVGPNTSLLEARQVMLHRDARMLFVVERMPGVTGLITATDLEGERPMQVSARRGVSYEKLVVADVMSDLNSLDTVKYENLCAASVGGVVATLRQTRRHHLLVVQKSSGQGPARVKGVISRCQIERQLGRSLTAPAVAAALPA